VNTAFESLAVLLRELAGVVAQLSADEYAAPGIYGASSGVGGHVRHCLDHVHALEGALRTRQIDYDDRSRGTAIERDRDLALHALLSAAERLGDVDDRWLTAMVCVKAQLSTDGRPVEVNSTIGRELAFVVSHTIHHSAMLKLMLHRPARSLPLRFGMAASTPTAVA
jgi:hypothetical protein